MSFLVRTRVGAFTLTEAKTLEEIAAEKEAALLPVDYAISHLPQATLPEQLVKAFQNGRQVPFEANNSGIYFRVYDQAGQFIGIGSSTPEHSLLSPVKVIS
jgi:tRNA pseudouridine55 synthase